VTMLRSQCRPMPVSRHVKVPARASSPRPSAHVGTVGSVIEIQRFIEVTQSVRARPAVQLVVKVSGDVDADTGSTMFVELTQAIDAVPAVCCDLSGTAFFGAEGANVLAVAHLHAARVQGSFSVRGVQGMAARVLSATGLTEILHIWR
jgi:anti-anti-sigma factor